MMELKWKSNRPAPNPARRANPISKLLFLWLIPLFRKGYAKTLEAQDLYPVLEEDETRYLGNRLDGYWNLELERAKVAGDRPSLLRALIKMAWRTFAVVTAFNVVNQCVFIVAQPVFLRLLILTFRQDTDTSNDHWEAYVYAGAICLIAFLQTLITQPTFYQIIYLGMKLRVATSALIYRKSLRLSKSAQQETNSGQIVNLLSNDCARFDSSFMFLPYLVVAPIQTVIFTYLLYEQIGMTSFAGVAFILLLLPMQYFLVKFSAHFRRETAKRTDERGRLMNQIIIGMRTIKQYAWERPFSALIQGTRKDEMSQVRKRALLRGLHNAIYRISLKLVPYLTFLLFVLTGDEPMTADQVFFTLTCLYTMLQTTVQFAPQAAAGIGEFLVAVHRLQKFLLLDEQTPNDQSLPTCNLIVNQLITGNGVSQIAKVNPKPTSNTGRITMKNVNAKWVNDGRLTLEDITLSLGGDKLVMIVGPVGSSKTSLLHAIIKELPHSLGNLNVNGSISYASQEPWIFAGNLRQNILFGLPYDEGNYKQTLKVCALEEDLQQLPHGDMSIVGERGITLSGGQKARLNLARAVYRKSDIYLLDDPLSAVDTKVSRHLFEKCIKEHLGGSLRILVTHQHQYLPQADVIIVLDQGKILAQGSFEELTAAEFDFAGLLANNNEMNDGGAVTKIREVCGPMIEVKLTEEEKRKPEENIEKKMEGSVTGQTYRDYFMAGHSVFGFLGLMTIFILCQFSTSGNDYWLSFWTNAEANRMNLEGNVTLCSGLADKTCEGPYLGENTYLYIYTGFAAGVTLFNLFRGLWFYMYCATISANIHEQMFGAVVRAPIKFFDDNPSGRIMNRFTKDVGIMDELLPPVLIDTLTIFLHIFGVICVVIISNYYMILPTLLLFAVVYAMRKMFMETTRDLKRIESVARSPIFTQVASTIQGLTTIRACKSQKLLITQFEQTQDAHSSAWFLFIATTRCFGIWLELVSDMFLVFVAFSFLVISSSTQVGNVGLAISSMLTMMNNFPWAMRQSAETENYMTSVERAMEYSKLTPEVDLDSTPESKPSQDWPSLGQIEFRNVSLSYEEGKPVLKNLSFKIRPSEQIGIVGRTGAGKSSIIAALFRLTEPEGDIVIDNVPIKQIGLHDLRKNISIIPQDPILFSGSVRYNLDPFNQFEDDQIWRVIEEVELKDAVPCLDYRVEDGGANFSVGQRQLVCLARAILRKNKILVLDEATANVDPRTDRLIQETLCLKFSDCTVITIAHRLHSVIGCDRILVLDHGELKQFDHPHVLLQDPEGIFCGMIAQTGQNTSAVLRKMAHEAFSVEEKIHLRKTA